MFSWCFLWLLGDGLVLVSPFAWCFLGGFCDCFWCLLGGLLVAFVVVWQWYASGFGVCLVVWSWMWCLLGIVSCVYVAARA